MYKMQDVVETIGSTFREMRAMVLAGAGNSAVAIKTDGTPQTPIDITAETVMRSKLSLLYADVIHYGEESGYPKELPDSCWLIDALDGTKSYIVNEPAFTGMAVLIEQGIAKASVIYNYSTDDLFVAIRSGGAFKNGIRLHVADLEVPGFAFCRERMVSSVNELLGKRTPAIVCEPGPSGAGYGFSLVAEAKIAARFNFPHVPGGGYIHDYAPGALLVEEAGGVLISIEEGEDYSVYTKSFIACHPKIAPLLIELKDEIKRIESDTVLS